MDYLLETGKQSFAISTQQPIYESYDLEDREKLIIEYLNKNPGSTKEQVVNGLEKHYSRIPIIQFDRKRVNNKGTRQEQEEDLSSIC